MATRVRFRFDKLTGEVLEFLVDDQDQSLPEAEHDRVALEVGRMLARHPGIEEVVRRPAAPEAEPEPEPTPADRATRRGEG